MEWRKEFEVKIRLFDAQHQELFRNVQALEKVIQSGDLAKSQEVFAKLISAKKRHFQDEEAALARHGYPGLSKQRVDHAAFIQKLQDIQKSAKEYPEAINMELIAMIDAWVVGHIQGADQAYSEYLRGCGER